MHFSDLSNETYAALVGNKVRSSLTVLGIVIGIGSVIAMISIGQGAQQSIEERIESIGSNLLMVYPGASRTTGTRGVSHGAGSAETLTTEDADALLLGVQGISGVAPEVSTRVQVVAGGNNTNTSVVGVTDTYADVRNVTLDTGSFITASQTKGYAKVAVLGPTTRDDLFGENTNAIGQKIRINGVIFTVIGILTEEGGTGFGSADDRILIPLSTEQQYITGSKAINTLYIKVAEDADMDTVQSNVTNILLKTHNIPDGGTADFTVYNQADIVETASSVTGTFTLLLGAVAGISLLVGGIGIMNMMLTTVTERTREIGLRKALGAKNKEITFQFLAEAVALTTIGGVIGIIFGWGTSTIIGAVSDLSTSVTLSLILLAFGVSATIGIIFGWYPARKASRLSPIEALRYE